jgi:hypothetical protein
VIAEHFGLPYSCIAKGYSKETHHGDGWGSSRVVVVGGLLVKSPFTAETEVAIFRVAAFTSHRFA